MTRDGLWIDLAAAAATAVLSAGLAVLFRRWFRAGDAPPAEQIEALKAEYAGWTLGAVPLLLLSFAGLSAVYFFTLAWIAGAVAAWRGPADFVITPHNEFYLLPALLLGMTTSTVPVTPVYRWLLGERYAEFCIVSRYGEGYDAARALKWLLPLIVAAALGVFLLLADHYAVFTADRIATDPFIGLRETRRAYADVDSVYAVEQVVTRSGEHTAKPYCAIVFRDGAFWTSRDDDLLRLQSADELGELVARRAGVALRRVTTWSPDDVQPAASR